MAANRLKLNAEMTELLWAGSRYSARDSARFYVSGGVVKPGSYGKVLEVGG